VIKRLANDLRREFPDMKGLSPTNLQYMRAFAAAWPGTEPIYQRPVLGTAKADTVTVMATDAATRGMFSERLIDASIRHGRRQPRPAHRGLTPGRAGPRGGVGVSAGRARAAPCRPRR
jgi:hypothetical protein